MMAPGMLIFAKTVSINEVLLKRSGSPDSTRVICTITYVTDPCPEEVEDADVGLGVEVVWPGEVVVEPGVLVPPGEAVVEPGVLVPPGEPVVESGVLVVSLGEAVVVEPGVLVPGVAVDEPGVPEPPGEVVVEPGELVPPGEAVVEPVEVLWLPSVV